MDTSTRKCSQCGSPLIETSNNTVHMEGTLFPQTTKTYRCSNQECQDEQDKQTNRRLKQQQEKVDADEKRTALKLKQKQAMESITAEEKLDYRP